MKANELRVGNYIYYDNQLMEVDHSEITDLYFQEDCPFHKPIPLTEEWLDKFGFKVNDCENYQTEYKYQLNNPFIILDRKDGYFYIDATNLEIKYVHQIQNLYFALIGEELEIKE